MEDVYSDRGKRLYTGLRLRKTVGRRVADTLVICMNAIVLLHQSNHRVLRGANTVTDLIGFHIP